MRDLLLIFVVIAGGCATARETESPGKGDGAQTENLASWGQACDDERTCGGGAACLTNERFVDGYCTQLCAEEACGSEETQCTVVTGHALCLKTCRNASDCRDGYMCFQGTCRPNCTTNSECGESGAVCENGGCVGAECTEDSHCAEGQTCQDNACVAPREDGSDPLRVGDPCEEQDECGSGICLPSSLGGTCARGCRDVADCRDAEVCSPAPIDSDSDGTPDVARAVCHAPGEGLLNLLGMACASDAECESNACIDERCVEACNSDDDCLGGQTCTTLELPGLPQGTFSGCGYAGFETTGATYDIDLGTLTLSAGSPSHRTVFGIPSDAVSVTIMAHILGGEEMPMSFLDVRNPAAESLYSYEGFVDYVDQPIRWYPSSDDDIISMLVPNTTPDRVDFQTGRYTFTMLGFSGDAGTMSADVELTARVKRLANVDEGVIDLNVYLVGVGTTAANAEDNQRLQQALEYLDEIYTQAGIRLRNIEYFDVSSSDSTRFGVINSSRGYDSELSQMFRLSEGQTNNAVNIFLVREISEEALHEGGILGIAGGIPGPPGVHGTGHSGVAVSFDPDVVGSGSDGAAVVAQIAAHETGHYLGLFHVRENGRACGASESPTESNPCSPFGGEDVLSDTSRSDGDNLMYYALGGSDGRTFNVSLSEGQGFVMRRNPLVQAN